LLNPKHLAASAALGYSFINSSFNEYCNTALDPLPLKTPVLVSLSFLAALAVLVP